MTNDRKNRIREEQERAAWYGVAQVEDKGFVHHKTSSFGRNVEGECTDIVAPMEFEEAREKGHQSVLQIIGKILLFLIAGVLLACMFIGLYQGV